MFYLAYSVHQISNHSQFSIDNLNTLQGIIRSVNQVACELVFCLHFLFNKTSFKSNQTILILILSLSTNFCQFQHNLIIISVILKLYKLQCITIFGYIQSDDMTILFYDFLHCHLEIVLLLHFCQLA